MRLYYHDLLNRKVIASDGRRVGRVSDLIAERRGDALRVTALVVGTTGLIQRIGFRRWSGWPFAPECRLPWSVVAAIGDEVHLRVDSAGVTAAAAGQALQTPASETPASETPASETPASGTPARKERTP